VESLRAQKKKKKKPEKGSVSEVLSSMRFSARAKAVYRFKLSGSAGIR
jgi:hypothetical protein